MGKYDNHVLYERRAGLAVITLNRAESLNALSLDMVRSLQALFLKIKNDPDIRAVLIDSAPGRAFCAGGDLKQLYDNGMAYRREELDRETANIYLREEYTLDRSIAEIGVPVISLLDGICMGGGYGLAHAGTHSVACENTVFAMPEVHIGLFPDVGTAATLANAPNAYGVYLALTGAQIDGAAMVEAGFADAFIPVARHERLSAALVDMTRPGPCDEADVSALLSRFHEDQPAALLAQNKKGIQDVFSKDNVASILTALEAREGDSGFACEALRSIRSACPVSVHITHSHLMRMKDKAIADVLDADLELATAILAAPNLYEGIRARMLDKDFTPQWSPATIEAVDAPVLAWYFEK